VVGRTEIEASGECRQDLVLRHRVRELRQDFGQRLEELLLLKSVFQHQILEKGTCVHESGIEVWTVHQTIQTRTMSWIASQQLRIVLFQCIGNLRQVLEAIAIKRRARSHRRVVVDVPN